MSNVVNAAHNDGQNQVFTSIGVIGTLGTADARGTALTLPAAVDPLTGAWYVKDINSSSGTSPVSGTVSISDGGTVVAKVYDFGIADALAVAIVDNSGNQITNTGGKQYQQGEAIAGNGTVTVTGASRDDALSALGPSEGEAQVLSVDGSGALWTHNIAGPGTINTGTINSGTINVSTVNSGTINAGTINSSTVNVATINAGTLGTVSNIGQVHNAGTIAGGTMQLSGTPNVNIISGTVNAATIGTVTGVGVVTTVSNITNGTIRVTAGTEIITSGSIAVTAGTMVMTTGTVNSGTINAGTIRDDGRPARNILTFGTVFGNSGSANSTIVGSAAVGAGTSIWVTSLSVINNSTATGVDAGFSFGTILAGSPSLFRATLPPGGGIQESYPHGVNAGMTNFDLTAYASAGTCGFNVSYFISA